MQLTHTQRPEYSFPATCPLAELGLKGMQSCLENLGCGTGLENGVVGESVTR